MRSIGGMEVTAQHYRRQSFCSEIWDFSGTLGAIVIFVKTSANRVVSGKCWNFSEGKMLIERPGINERSAAKHFAGAFCRWGSDKRLEIGASGARVHLAMPPDEVRPGKFTQLQRDCHRTTKMTRSRR
jgi:hypothetical protein